MQSLFLGFQRKELSDGMHGQSVFFLFVCLQMASLHMNYLEFPCQTIQCGGGQYLNESCNLSN